MEEGVCQGMTTPRNMLSNMAAYLLANPGINWRVRRVELSRAGETETSLREWARKYGFVVKPRPQGGWLVRNPQPKGTR